MISSTHQSYNETKLSLSGTIKIFPWTLRLLSEFETSETARAVIAVRNETLYPWSQQGRPLVDLKRNAGLSPCPTFILSEVEAFKGDAYIQSWGEKKTLTKQH